MKKYARKQGCGELYHIVSEKKEMLMALSAQNSVIPVILETARLLAALIRPNHLVRLSSWGLTRLPPPCSSNAIGYSRRTQKFLSLSACLLLVTLCSGCATNKQETPPASKPQANKVIVQSSHGSFELAPTVVSYEAETFSDPLEGFNRSMFAFNDFVFSNVLTPVARGYQTVVPEPVRGGVSNFFSNIREPLNALNHGLQGRGSDTGVSLGRFLINSTIGILGLFDPADHWFAIKEKKANLNQTFSSYGMGYGSFLVLPFLGQTDTRNGFSTLIEGIIHPINSVTDAPQTLYIEAYGSFHEFAPQADSYETLREQSDDPYLFFRNLYLQGVLRDEQFSEGTMPSEAFQLNPHSSGQKALDEDQGSSANGPDDQKQEP